MAAPRVPAPVSGVDVLSLPLSTTEGFVLSRVDGATSVDDISMMSGIDKAKLLAILERLADLGAVELAWYRPPPRVRSQAKTPELNAAASSSPRYPTDHFAIDPPPYLASELEAPGDLSIDVKKRILNAYYGMEGKNYYELLGVPRNADRAAIRAAYFAMSKVFHPDSLFGKQLHDFKPKMELVFKRLTQAYEVLGKKKKRAEYDEYLRNAEAAQGMQDTLEAVEQAADALRQGSEIPPAPPRPDGVHSVPISGGSPSMDPGAAIRGSLRAPRSNAERRARVRERLRKQFRSGSTRPEASPSVTPSESEPARREPANDTTHESPEGRDGRRQSLLEGLRQSIRASASVSSGGDIGARVQRHLHKARVAERSGDVLGAASELQLAMALDTSNAQLKREYERVERAVAAQLADNYEKQAHYEEKTGNWKAAASSWARVVDGRPGDADAARSSANALLKSGGDLHRAQKYAQTAVRLAPNSVVNLAMLARVYLAAGLKLNARRELEKAAKLDADDEIVKNLLRDAR